MSEIPTDFAVHRKDIAQRIRARGAVLDLELARQLYHPLLEHQRRDGAHVTRDVEYGLDERHRLDIYRPEASHSVPRPVLIFFHGGGFVRGNKADRENVGYCFARHGYVVVIPNYRLAPTHRWPAGAQDVIAVWQWTLAHTQQFAIDTSRVFIAGESAGAAHVAAATLLKRFHPSEGLHPSGVILISGVYNVHLEKLARQQFGVATPDPRNEAYFGSDFERYPAMSTVELIDAPPIPLLISFAELDLLQMQVQASELFARLVCRHSFMPDLIVVPGHNHLTQVYAINTGDEALTGPLLEFMRRREGIAAR